MSVTKIGFVAAALSLVDGARMGRRTKVSTKYVAGVAVHNHHLAFKQSWRETMMQTEGIKKDQEVWMVQMKKGISEESLDLACKHHTQCVDRGHAAGNPYLELLATEKELEEVLAAEGADIEFVEPNMPVNAIPEIASDVSVSSVSWGLRRIRSRGLSSMPGGDLGSSSAGRGAHVYVLDTGIRTTHTDFSGRATPAAQVNGMFFPYMKECAATDTSCALDKQGHGTHCAGTAAGSGYGVAKGASIYAVKVLGDNGSGSNAGINKALDWLASNYRSPAVASMSLGGGYSASGNAAVDSLVSAGVTVVTASGNENTDACTKSPGSAPMSMNVGATDINDKRSYFSNYGTCLDIYAPGSDILSSLSTSDTASASYSGTSMACPHVSGVSALILASSPSMAPSQVKSRLVADATSGVVSDAKSGSPNKLLYTSM